MLDSTCTELRDEITASVQRNLSNAILLSGGLDSSILACIVSRFTDLTGITVTYNDAPDLKYAKIIAARYSIRHLVKHLTIADINGAIENVIRIMQSFDPMEVRNTAVVYSSVKALKENGFNSVMTGDGGDELFAGYNYILRLKEDKLEDELKRLWDTMHFSSVKIGKELGVSVRLPFLDDRFVEFAKKIPVLLKVREHDGTRWGKWILRQCFQDEITKDIAWRTKMPLEQGAGTSALTQYFHSRMDDDFDDKAKRYAGQDYVKIRDREHLHYYELYRKFFSPPREGDCEVRCPDCKGCTKKDSRFCRICGAFPIRPT